jgi:hypothetical protein
MNRPSLENLGTRPLFDLFGEWPLETKKNIAVAEHHQDLAVLVELEDFLTKHGAGGIARRHAEHGARQDWALSRTRR